MVYRSARSGFFLLPLAIAVFFLVLSGCGPGGSAPAYDDPLLPLGVTDQDISRFNGRHIYTLIAPVPKNKPQSNNQDPSSWPSYSFLLYTTAVTRAPEEPTHPLVARDLGPAQKPPLSKQAEQDLNMRRVENELLAGKARQLSGRPMAPYRVPPSPIAIGTVWNDVYVYNNPEAAEPVTIDTTCRHISTHAYFFVDNRDIAAMDPYLADYGQAFDQIHQINHDKFGTENDVDKNGKIIIVFSRELTDNLLGR